MALKALKIVEEEFGKIFSSWPGGERVPHLVKLEADILRRIEQECVEQPEPETCLTCGGSALASPTGFCSSECDEEYGENG